MNRYQIMDWDTKFFGFPVARILPDRMTRGELERTIASLKEAAVRLAYWASDPGDASSQEAAKACDGFLADRKVTYLIDLGRASDPAVAVEWAVEPYGDPLPCAELEALAVRICAYSRFKVDPRMPDGACEDIYKMWIRNSVNRTIADEVLVIRDSGRIAGMVTLGEKQGRADIGLLAVAVGMEGKNVGVSLVRAAQEWARGKGYRFAQVVTQGENVAARRLYEKCGYTIDKIENYYHFWI
jgi:dTDP-4-amino-4,6-dideoxy-D-galactose acyltransferase